MATTNAKTILTALRTRIAENPPTPILKELRRERRRLMNYDPGTAAGDAAADLQTAYNMIKGTAVAALALGESEVNADLAILAAAYPTLPADDPIASVIDQKKIRLKTRALLADALLQTAPTDAWLARRLEDFKRRQINDYQATDPCEAKFAQLLTQVQTSSDENEVRAAIMTLQNMWNLLEPVSP